MTCVVGIETEAGVTIGADSMSSNGHTGSANGGKVFRVGELLVGCCGSIRMKQLLRYSLHVPPIETWDLDRWMATDFINSARECLKQGGYATIVNGEEAGGTFMVGVRGRLYTVYGDYQINYKPRRYHAVGSGEHIALGALYVLRDLPPHERATAALEAAAEHVISVGPPFEILTLDVS